MSPSKAYIIGSGQPTLDDALKVILSEKQDVVLDKAAADRVKKESPPPKSFEAEAFSPPEPNALASACLDRTQARAAVFFKLASLANGKSKCRVAVLEFLAALLTSQISPRLPATDADAAALTALADAMHGYGHVSSPEGLALLPQVLERASMQAPGLSAAERAALVDGQAASAGTGALCVHASRTLLSLATAIAALSADALQADVKSFDPDVVESLPYKGAADVAEAMRSYLEGSRRVNAKKGGVGSLPSLNDATVVHAAAQQDVLAAIAPVRAVLHSGALPPTKDGLPQQASSPALPSALLALAASLLRCTALSLRRSDAIIERVASSPSFALHPPDGAQDESQTPADGSSATALQAGLRSLSSVPCMMFESAQQQVAAAVAKVTMADEVPPSLSAALAAYAAVHALQDALANEALAALLALRLEEGAPAAAPASNEANGVPAAETDAPGSKKKGKKKGGNAGGGMMLGKGSLLLRQSLESATVLALGGDGGAAVNGQALAIDLTTLSLNDRGAALSRLRSAVTAINSQLDPVGSLVGQHLAAIASVLEGNAARRKPKVAKGARDFAPDQMAIREVAFEKIINVFKRHGAVSIDTPVFELRETLTGKYGEDSKLIYDLADQGGELLSLRYDLTVPFARYVALNGITNIKRYHIAKVYRRDQPQMTRGRFREFFQCDFDVAGTYATMVPDAEVIKVLVEILSDLKLGEYEVKLNHRQLLDAMLDIAGVPPQKFRTICSAIDKLDKETWETVRAEMTEEKGLSEEAADRIGEFVVHRGQPMELLARLSTPGHPLAEHPASAAALAELRVLFEFLQGMDALGRIVFDLSLARGLDYYTGVIYEAVLKGGNVGSIAAGGRYDKLVGMFSGKEVPAVGVSIGIERVFAIMEAQMRAAAEAANGVIRETQTDCLVASIGSGHQQRRMTLASRLWAEGVRAEFGYKPNPKMSDQLGYALKNGIPFIALFGEDEMVRGVVRLKDLDAGTEEEVAEADLLSVLAERAAAKGERRIAVRVDAEQEKCEA